MKGGRGSASAADSRLHHHDEHHPVGVGGGGWGLSWPPRFYTCNFCRREFRSAQALGGHMNVHRRDRARLRLQPPNPNPNLSLNLIPNPNVPTPPSLASSSSNHHNRVFTRYKHVGRPSSPHCSAIFDPKKLLVVRKQANTRPRGGVLKLGLEIGIFDHDTHDDDQGDENEDEDDEELNTGLDLELRLGYSH